MWLTDESRSKIATFEDVVKDADPYTQRLASGATDNSWYTWFKDSLLAVTRIADPDALFANAWKIAISRSLGAAMQKPSTRFVPDRTPQPIPIAIGASPSADDLHRFTAFFNGTALLLQRKSAKWAHANLASLYPLKIDGSGELQYDDAWSPGAKAVKPFLPVSMDGRRETFIPYYGLPLASPAYARTGGADLPSVEPDSTANPLRCAFYSQGDVVFSGPGIQKPPRLGYGLEYSACAFAVSKAGALPRVLQDAAAGFPWTPAESVDATTFTDVKSDFGCQRFTAIGSTTFGSQSDAQRIGAQYPEIYPLAMDFPSTVLTVGNGSIDTVDLFRRSDGVGQLPCRPRPCREQAPCLPSMKKSALSH